MQTLLRRNVWAVVLIVMATGIALAGCRSEETANSDEAVAEDEAQARIISIVIVKSLGRKATKHEANYNPTSPASPADSQPIEPLTIHLHVPEDNPAEVVVYLGDLQEPLSGFEELEEKLLEFRKKGLSEEHPVMIMPRPEVQHKWFVKAFDIALVAGFKNFVLTVPR